MAQSFHGEGPASVVLIHAWKELGPSSRIRLEFQPAEGEHEQAFATSVPDAMATVREWLGRALDQ